MRNSSAAQITHLGKTDVPQLISRHVLQHVESRSASRMAKVLDCRQMLMHPAPELPHGNRAAGVARYHPHGHALVCKLLEDFDGQGRLTREHHQVACPMRSCLTGVLKTESLYMSATSQITSQYITDAVLAVLAVALCRNVQACHWAQSYDQGEKTDGGEQVPSLIYKNCRRERNAKVPLCEPVWRMVRAPDLLMPGLRQNALIL